MYFGRHLLQPIIAWWPIILLIGATSRRQLMRLTEGLTKKLTGRFFFRKVSTTARITLFSKMVSSILGIVWTYWELVSRCDEVTFERRLFLTWANYWPFTVFQNLDIEVDPGLGSEIDFRWQMVYSNIIQAITTVKRLLQSGIRKQVTWWQPSI